MNPQYPLVAARAAHRCEYCRAPESIFNFPFEVEHIVPPKQGGSDDESNLALSCRACNLFKSSHLEYADPESGDETPLFNPRSDQWADCFRIDIETGAIVGRNATGRATIACLSINSSAQCAARMDWMRLGLFP